MSQVEFKQKLLGEMIAVQPIDPKPSKILLPDWQRTLRGLVLAVGPGAPLPGGRHKPMQCAPGDYIIFGAATGMESSYKGVALRVMRDSDVDAVLEDVA